MLGCLLLICCSDDAESLRDSGAGPDVVTEVDVGPLCGGEPQPTCPTVWCCTQVNACGVCSGDTLNPTTCVDGAWSCGAGRRLIAECKAFLGGDSGPDLCDAGR